MNLGPRSSVGLGLGATDGPEVGAGGGGGAMNVVVVVDEAAVGVIVGAYVSVVGA